MQNRFMDQFWDLPNATRFSLESILSLYFNSRWCSNLHGHVLTNARYRRQIGARSRERQSYSVNYQRRDLREHRCDSQSCCVNEFWLKNTLAMTYNQWEQDTGQREVQGELFFTKRLAIYKQCAYILALEYTDQVGYMKMKKCLWFFL